MSEPQSVIHPYAKRVPLRGGSVFVIVQPFSMVTARAVRPIIVRILQGITAAGDQLDLAEIVEKYEADVLEIVQRAVDLPASDLPSTLNWSTLDYEDFLNLAQAVWETSILRADGGGILGKVLGLTAGALRIRRGLLGTVSAQQFNGAEPTSSQRDTAPTVKN